MKIKPFLKFALALTGVWCLVSLAMGIVFAAFLSIAYFLNLNGPALEALWVGP